MRILIVANNCSKRMGGEAILPYHYFRLMMARGMDCHLIAHARNRAELLELFPEHQSRIHFVSDSWFNRVAWALGALLPTRVAEVSFFAAVFLRDNLRMSQLARDLIRQHGIDVVHQPIPVSPKEPSFLSATVPVVIGPMNGGMEYPPGFLAALGHVDRIAHFVAKRGADFLNILIRGKRRAALLLYANERTRLALPRSVSKVPMQLLAENGVDLALWRSAWSDGAIDQRTDFLFVGRLVELKGVHYLLRAFALISTNVTASVTIVGDGPERGPLEKLCASLGITDRVRFIGFLPQQEVPPLMKRALALILPSLSDCGGAVVLEAMAAQVAVIATAWGGPLDYLTSESGILVEPANDESFVRGLAEAMLRLANSPELAASMGRAGLKRVEELFSWERKMDQMLDVYRSVAARTR